MSFWQTYYHESRARLAKRPPTGTRCERCPSLVYRRPGARGPVSKFCKQCATELRIQREGARSQRAYRRRRGDAMREALVAANKERSAIAARRRA